MRFRPLATAVLLVSCIMLVMLLGSCGGRQPGPPTPPAPSGTGLQSQLSDWPAAGLSTADALSRIESTEAPANVDDARWQQLTAELARVLASRDEARLAAAPPQGFRNRVADLHIEEGGSGEFILAWTYVSAGDYDQNSEVGVSDLTPIGVHFGARPGDLSWGAAQIADGDRNGEVGVSDITPIGQNFLARTVAYNVYTSADEADYPADDGAANGPGALLVGTAEFDSSTIGLGGQRQFSVVIDTPVEGNYYWVRPTDGETDGSPSNLTRTDTRGDWWMHGREPTHNARSPFFGPRSSNVAWTYLAGDEIYGAPVVRADGWVYFGSFDDSLHAVNAQGGAEWTFPTGDDVEATPAIAADGTIYFGSWDGNLYAVNPDGTLKWSLPSAGSEAWFSPAIGPDGTIYVGCNDNSVYAIRQDETVAWSYPTGDAVHACPAVGPDDAVYVGSYDGNVYAINSDGSERWTFATGDQVSASVALAADGTVYAGSEDRQLYAIGPDGAELWRFNADGYIGAAPAIGADGAVYLGTMSGNLFAINPDGSLRWRFDAHSGITASPAIGADGIIYVGNRFGSVYAVNQNGTQHWRYDSGNDIGIGLAIGGDGTLYAGNRDGELHAFSGGEAGTPATVLEVPPTEGATGAELTLSAIASGTPPLGFSWDLAGGATPNDPSETQPTVTLGEPGIYSASVTVQNDYGPADTMEFTLYVHPAGGPPTVWIHSWGGSLGDDFFDLAVDSGGHIHAVGSTDSFGAGSYDALLAEYDSAGTLISARTWGGEDVDEALAIAIDSADNVYVAGSHEDGYDLNALLLRFDADGSLSWARSWDYAPSDVIKAVAVGSDGRIHAGGYSHGTGSGTRGALFLTYSSDGVVENSSIWDTDGREELSDVAVGADGDLTFVGDLRNDVPDTDDVLIFHVTSAGDLSWVRSYASDTRERLPSVALDGAGNAYVSGYSSQLLMYNAAGELQWARLWQGDFSVLGVEAAVLDTHLVLVGGVVDDNNLNPAVFFGDTGGSLAWSRQYITAYDDDLFFDLALTSLDQTYIVGELAGSLGTWQDLTMTSADASGASIVPAGTEDTPVGEVSDVTGTLIEVTGVEDTGGGSYDCGIARLDLSG